MDQIIYKGRLFLNLTVVHPIEHFCVGQSLNHGIFRRDCLRTIMRCIEYKRRTSGSTAERAKQSDKVSAPVLKYWLYFIIPVCSLLNARFALLRYWTQIRKGVGLRCWELGWGIEVTIIFNWHCSRIQSDGQALAEIHGVQPAQLESIAKKK